jgi:signal transduction histidine kinase
VQTGSQTATVTAESRVALYEALIGADDPADCAQKALEWLRNELGAKQAICLSADAETPHLVAIATLGIEHDRASAYSVPLDATTHPLVALLTARSTQPIRVALGEGARTTDRGTLSRLPFSGEAAQAVALGVDGISAPGLLVTSPLGAGKLGPLEWLAVTLGKRVRQLRLWRHEADARERLARERSLLYGIINAVPDPILLTDTEGRMIIANARAEALFASADGESEGRRRAIALNNMLFTASLSQRAHDGGDSPRREVPLVNPSDGSDLLFEPLSATPMYAREASGIVTILRNVTDLRRATDELEENYRRLRQAEAEIRAERDRLEIIIDSVADPILVTSPAGHLILMNAPAERLFQASDGASRAELSVIQSNDAHFSSFLSNLLLQELRWRGELGLFDPQSGNAIPVEAVAGKILSEHGELTAVVTILHDRSEELEKGKLFEQIKRASSELEQKVREATAELVRQNELLRRQAIELEQASALKSQFLANMSHEFRTPLNAILGYTSMLLQGVSGGLNPQQRKGLTRVDSNSRHLLSIINDILDIARIEAGRMPLHVSAFKLPDLIAEVMAEVEPIIARSRLKVTSQLQKGLPAVRSDRQKVKQIVINLLTNALKFTSEGSIRVMTSHQRARDQISIAVQDTGIGIAEKDHRIVFEDFRQADNSPTREYGGAGLGLSICNRLATMLGGRLALASRVGQGSTFTLTFPRTRRRG